MMSIGLSMEMQMRDDNGEQIQTPVSYGNFECPKCGERHSSDTAMLLCGSEYQKSITKAIAGE
jgi:predicted RNA-binding Zn-ribbon protein involved in translation (DUF1610 family)